MASKTSSILVADKKTVSNAFKVEINGQFLPIKSYSGGSPITEKPEASSPLPGTKQEQALSGGTLSKGQQAISELSLTAYITPDQNILTDAMNAVANQGKNERFTITVTEMAKDKSVVKTVIYEKCLITSLDFPTMDANGGEILCETATFKPESITIK